MPGKNVFSQPNTIPRDGSTIKVWVDGVPQHGNPLYNQYREDIVKLFPGYNNSNGAGGHYYLDTTLYTNGVHTISWNVTDDAGNTDDIGSRDQVFWGNILLYFLKKGNMVISKRNT